MTQKQTSIRNIIIAVGVTLPFAVLAMLGIEFGIYIWRISTEDSSSTQSSSAKPSASSFTSEYTYSSGDEYSYSSSSSYSSSEDEGSEFS